MKTTWLGCVSALVLAGSAFGGGTVDHLNQVALEAAMAGGGTVIFAVSGTLTLTNTIVVTKSTTLDGNGNSVVISGGNAVRLFQVANPVDFSLKGLTLSDGRVVGTNGVSATNGIPGGPGETAFGAGILNQGGNLTLTDCALSNHVVRGGNGGFGSAIGPGPAGAAMGAAICTVAGKLSITNCVVTDNIATGGQSGAAFSPQQIASADALGGAIYAEGGSVVCQNITVSNNSVVGGPASPDWALTDGGGLAGNGVGGGIFASNSTWLIGLSTIVNNTAQGGPSETSGNGAGDGKGGALFISQGSTCQIGSSFFGPNSALGGPSDERPLPPSGDGLGGQIYNRGSLQAYDSSFSGGTSIGGSGLNYIGGAGKGGGIYSTGELVLTRCAFSGGLATSPGSTGGRPGMPGEGGALWISGSLNVTNCTFVGNSAAGGSSQVYGGGGFTVGGGGPANGGAICVAGGETVIINSLVATNQADGGAAEGLAQGGGLSGSTNSTVIINGCTFVDNVAAGGDYNYGEMPNGLGTGGAISSAGSLYVTNSTFTANRARGGHCVRIFVGSCTGASGPANGGAINVASAMTVLGNVTVAANSAGEGTLGINGRPWLGGGISITNGSVLLHNSIIASNTPGGDVWGSIMDAGHNLCSDNTAAFSAPGSLNNTDPKLSTLGDFGGPTPTMALLAGSPAINGGDNVGSPSIDQRGRARPFGGTVDIGAFESSPPYVLAGTVSGLLSDDTIRVSAGAANTQTTNGGAYRFDLPSGTYTVTPAQTDYLIMPPSQALKLGPDRPQVGFAAFRWNALTVDGLNNSALHLTYASTIGGAHELLLSTNLLDWTSVSTNTTGPSNAFEIFDPSITNEALRFYRVRTQQ